jgi:hypothetical protein
MSDQIKPGKLVAIINETDIIVVRPDGSGGRTPYI